MEPDELKRRKAERLAREAAEALPESLRGQEWKTCASYDELPQSVKDKIKSDVADMEAQHLALEEKRIKESQPAQWRRAMAVQSAAAYLDPGHDSAAVAGAADIVALAGLLESYIATGELPA